MPEAKGRVQNAHNNTQGPFATVSTGLAEGPEGKVHRASPEAGLQGARAPSPDSFRLALRLLRSQWEQGDSGLTLELPLRPPHKSCSPSSRSSPVSRRPHQPFTPHVKWQLRARLSDGMPATDSGTSGFEARPAPPADGSEGPARQEGHR